MAEFTEARVELVEGLRFLGTGSSGHTADLDAAPAHGGAGEAATPMELMAMALGGCTGIDVISILRKKRQAVTGYEVRVRAERAPDHPKVFTRITVEHVVRGRSVDPAAVRRAVELSATTYCPASAMLGRVAPITERFRVIDDATGQETVGELEPAAPRPTSGR